MPSVNSDDSESGESDRAVKTPTTDTDEDEANKIVTNESAVFQTPLPLFSGNAICRRILLFTFLLRTMKTKSTMHSTTAVPLDYHLL
jgi:hypothetical protein